MHNSYYFLSTSNTKNIERSMTCKKGSPFDFEVVYKMQTENRFNLANVFLEFQLSEIFSCEYKKFYFAISEQKEDILIWKFGSKKNQIKAEINCTGKFKFNISLVLYNEVQKNYENILNEVTKEKINIIGIELEII